MCVATVNGTVVDKVGKGEWVVSDKSGKGEESELLFEAIAKSKASERCEIPLIHLESWGICTGPDGEILQGASFQIHKEGQILYSGKTDDKGELTVPFDYQDGMEVHFFNLKKK